MEAPLGSLFSKENIKKILEGIGRRFERHEQRITILMDTIESLKAQVDLLEDKMQDTEENVATTVLGDK